MFLVSIKIFKVKTKRQGWKYIGISTHNLLSEKSLAY